MKKKIKILLTCVGGRLIFDIIKAVRQTDDYIPEIIGVDSNPDAIGKLLCDHFYTIENVEHNPKEWLKRIFEIFEHHKFNLIFLYQKVSVIVFQRIQIFLNQKK